jgi:two-component system, OmpR family, sensor kinase
VSLRVRLLLAVGAVAVVALVAADLVTYAQLRSSLYSRVDQDLVQAAHPGLVGGPNPQGGPNNPNGNGITILVEVVTPAGEVVYSNTPKYGGETYAPALPAEITGYSKAPDGMEVTYFTTSSNRSGGPTFRVLAEKMQSGPNPGDVLVVAEPLGDVEATLRSLEIVEIIVSACALFVGALLGWWLIRRALSPLLAMERTAESIAAGELDERVPGANEKTEVGRLAGTLNVMLGRIQHAFAQRDATEAELRASRERLRQFVGDASHELRTPLAAVSAYAELFERGASRRPEDLERVLVGIRAETSRMGRLVEDLLLLARLDEGVPLASDPVELVSVASDAARTAEAVGPAWLVSLVAESPVEVTGDGSRIRQVIDNLLANVRAHTPPGTLTTVTVRTDRDQAVIEVADNGPGFTEEQAQKVFERFYRTDASRSRASGGAGLGLSIATSIIAAHGGSISARPGGDAGGAVFTVMIPLARIPVATE